MKQHLLPCPLCGSQPEVYFNGDYYCEYDFRIRCTNSQCELILPVYGMVLGPDDIRVDQKYLDRWNSRK